MRVKAGFTTALLFRFQTLQVIESTINRKKGAWENFRRSKRLADLAGKAISNNVLLNCNGLIFSSCYHNNDEAYYSATIVLIPTQSTKKIAARGTVSQHYFKFYLAPIFRPVIRNIGEQALRRKISAIGGLSDQAAGTMNFASGVDDDPLLRRGL